MEITDLISDCGESTRPGFAVTIYAVCPCDIDVFPARKTTTAVGDSITLDGNIVLKTDKKWATITAISDTVGLIENGVGVTGSKSIQSEFPFKVLKSIAADEWVDKHLNGCFVFLIQNKEGKIRVIGSKDIPATIETTVGSNGLVLSDEKNWALTVIDKTGRVAPYYEGTIDLTGA
jgi:hypothetical protein